MSGGPSDTFRQEVQELLEQVETGLLELEQTPRDAGLVDSVFRALHTIKGSGAMFGFAEVAGFVHEFETAFDRVRKGKAVATPALIALALAAKDQIHALVADPAGSAAGSLPLLEQLRRTVDAAAEPGAGAVPAGSPPPAGGGTTGWHIAFRLPLGALELGTNPQMLLDDLRALGDAVVVASTAAVPALEDIEPTKSYLAWDVSLVTSASRSEVEDVFMFLSDDMELRIEELRAGTGHAMEKPLDQAPAQAAPTAAAAEPAARRASAAGAAPDKPATSLRVPAERLDELMDRVGELVIAQARLAQLAHGSDDASLKSIAEELGRLSSGLRDTTMSIRMVPIGSLFGRFRRLVHDLSQDLGKPIDFVTAGEETELDKTVVDRLADPLVHLIRNAVDHGLEPQAARTGAGKRAEGTVRLAATYSGAEVAVSVTDDGAGLDAERIRAKAIEAGLLDADARLAESDLFQLIFQPGFSTAREVTSLSGRGVGMDVVKRTIEGLRGRIEVSSARGKGTTVTLRLPLTLAIIDGLLVRVGEGRYTVPLAAVEECVELPDTDGQGRSGRSFLDIRGSLVPFVRLRDQFGVTTPADRHQKVVIVSSGEGRVGLVVDQIIGNNQTVIKQLSPLHAGIRSFSGATILGDGGIALILDTAHLVGSGQAAADNQNEEIAA